MGDDLHRCRGFGDADPGGLLPPILLVADSSYRLFNRLQFRYVVFVVQFFCGLGLQCLMYALWRGGVV